MSVSAKLWAVVASMMLAGSMAVAGEIVDQGAPGNQGAWPIKCISGCQSTINVDGGLTVNATGTVTVDGGYITAIDPACASPKDTFFIPSTVDGGVCPPTPLSGRRSIILCNAVRNSTFGTPIITVTVDGTPPTPTINSPGQDLNVGDCITYNVPATTQTRCISDTADAGMKITECK